MLCRQSVGALLFAVLLLGCKGTSETASSNGADGSADGTAESSAGAPTGSGGGVQVDYIRDPTLNNMNAYSVKVPAGWHFEGVLFQSDSCVGVPLAVYRAISPDGTKMAEQVPGMAWQWGSAAQGAQAKKDCLPLKGPVSAQNFLKYFANVLKVNYASDEPVPADVNARAQKELHDIQASMAPRWASMHAVPPKGTRELARAIVTSQRRGVPMRGRLDLVLDCSEATFPGIPHLEGRPAKMVMGTPGILDSCTANVRYYTAAESQFASMMRSWDAPGMGGTSLEAWKQAWIQRSGEEGARKREQFGEESAALMQARQAQFNHDQAVRQQMHNQFIQGMNDNFQQHQAVMQANSDARQTAASDVVDYALDRQTVMNTNTGQVDKITNQVKPGGDLVKVHGNGTPW